MLELLRAAQSPARFSPFDDLRIMRGVVWIDQPRLLAEVSYAEIVGGRLRAPSWRLVSSGCSQNLRGERQCFNTDHETVLLTNPVGESNPCFRWPAGAKDLLCDGSSAFWCSPH